MERKKKENDEMRGIKLILEKGECSDHSSGFLMHTHGLSIWPLGVVT